MKLVTNKFKSGGLHEKHVVATCNLGNHLSICLQAQGNREKNLFRCGRSQDLPTSSDAVSFFFNLYSSLLLTYEIRFAMFCFNSSGYTMICTLCVTCTAQILILILEATVTIIQSYVFAILNALYSREVNYCQYTKITHSIQ